MPTNFNSKVGGSAIEHAVFAAKQAKLDADKAEKERKAQKTGWFVGGFLLGAIGVSIFMILKSGN